MNNILFLFREGGGGKQQAQIIFMFLCCPFFPGQNVQSTPVQWSYQNKTDLKKPPSACHNPLCNSQTLENSSSITLELWDYTYVSLPVEILNVHAMIMHLGSSKYQWNCQELLKLSPVQSMVHAQQFDSNKWAQNKSLMCLGHPICYRLLQKLTHT